MHDPSLRNGQPRGNLRLGMKRPTHSKNFLPPTKLADGAGELPTGEAFRPEWIDFDHGIRVGNLEPHERITQILKFQLEQRHQTRFITDRWGRGVYWQWICWLPRANREVKPVSHAVNFGCAKFFISADSEGRVFKSGLQIERGHPGDELLHAIQLTVHPEWGGTGTAAHRNEGISDPATSSSLS